MAHRSWSIQDAKNRFSEVVEAAPREPQTVTKRGNPAVVVLAAEEYERLQHLKALKAPNSTTIFSACRRKTVNSSD